MTTLRTQRLTLRPIEPDDAGTFIAFYGNPEVMAIRKFGVLDAQAARAKLRDMLAHWETFGFGMWAVMHDATGEFAGECGLRWLEDGSEVELSYGLLAPFRGRGLATEASRAALAYGADVLELERIVALSRGDNSASHRVLEKLGMSLEWRRSSQPPGLVKYAVARPEIRRDEA